MWLMWRALGDKGMGRQVDKMMENAEYIRNKIRNTPGFRLCMDEVKPSTMCNMKFHVVNYIAMTVLSRLLCWEIDAEWSIFRKLYSYPSTEEQVVKLIIKYNVSNLAYQPI